MTPAASSGRRARAARARTDGVTIEEVARRANVSVATVSRALRGLPNVAPATRSRVEAVANELNYQVDTYASRLATGRNDTVGLAVPQIDDWYFSCVAAGAERVLRDAGYDVLLHSVGDERGRQRLLAGPSPARRRLDGLILIDVLLSDAEAELLAAEGANVVTVGQHTEVFPSVTVDDVAAARSMTEHLLGLGHRRIALIGSDGATALPFDVPLHRTEGHRAALAAAGVPDDPALHVAGGFSLTGGHDAMVDLLQLPDPPTAVFALSDAMGVGALRAARELGVDVPGRVSVAGFDDGELASVFGLTTVHQDPTAQGAAAAELLLAHHDGDAAPEHVDSPTRLVLRASTGPVAGSR